eukprot:6559015-Ditylum_brightwellii.AAC.1
MKEGYPVPFDDGQSYSNEEVDVDGNYIDSFPDKDPHNITSLLSVESGGYVSGCKDGVIRMFDGAHSFSGELKGHKNAVTSLAWLPLSCSDDSSPDKELLLSGSWDGTAR